MNCTPDRLLSAYIQAAYEFEASGRSLRLFPGRSDNEAQNWLESNAESWAFITACNPRSVALCEEENRARHEDLERLLADKGWRYLPARGIDQSDNWPDEPGFLILDRALEEMVALNRRLGQSALVYGKRGSPPQVVVLETGWRTAVLQAGDAACMAPEDPANHILLARNLGFSRGDDWVFRHLDFEVTAGRVLLAEGANGSGKTTLVRALAGLLDFHEGELSWCGESVAPGSERLRGDIVYLGHRLSIKDELTALENLVYLCGLHGQPASETDCDHALAGLGLPGLQDVPASRLSAGQRKRVALARLALDRRPLWLLDEPYANLDRNGAAIVSKLIARHAGNGGLVVLTAHEGLTPDLPMLDRLSLGASHG